MTPDAFSVLKLGSKLWVQSLDDSRDYKLKTDLIVLLF